MKDGQREGEGWSRQSLELDELTAQGDKVRFMKFYR